MKRPAFLILASLTALLVTGFWVFSSPKEILQPTPQIALSKVIYGIEKKDKVIISENLTEDAFSQLKNLSSNSEWKKTNLYLKYGKKNNVADLWSILHLWSVSVKNDPHEWLVNDSAKNTMYPVFSKDESLTLIFKTKSNGDWILDQVSMSVAE